MGPLAANWMRSSGRQWHETETALARAEDSLRCERCQLPVGFAHQLQANKNKWGAHLLGTPPTVCLLRLMGAALFGLVVAAEDSQQTQNLNVEPHQGYYQAEGAGPGVAARSAGVYQRLSVLEVEHQGYSRHNHGNGAND